MAQSDAQQRNLALALARLTRPFEQFGRVLADGDDFDALVARLPHEASESNSALAVSTEQVRHRFWQMPVLATENEPDQPEWPAYMAVVAYIYAADAVITSPCDGLWHTYLSVQDLLHEAGQQAETPELVARLEAAVNQALAEGQVQPVAALQQEVEAVAARLREGRY